jgi:hypothetical protein
MIVVNFLVRAVELVGRAIRCPFVMVPADHRPPKRQSDGFDPVPIELHVVRDGVCWKVDLSVAVIEGEPYTSTWWSNVIWVANYFIDESVQDEA